MRYSTVLFDLDGTLIDSGEIILSSFRHATRTVLEREVPDEVLAAAIGGSNIYEQMRAFDEERADELVRVYREHNEPLHAELECCAGMDDVLVRLKEEGRRLGIVSAKRRLTVELAFARVPLAHLFDVVVGGDETERQKPEPDPLLLALERLGADPATAAYVGDSPFDMQAAKAAGMQAVGVTWGGIHECEALAEADEIVDTPEELLAVL
jgi:pyrophosphatase PpaX